jgi:hypothetical protein
MSPVVGGESSSARGCGYTEAAMVEDLSQRLRLSFDVDVSAPRKYAVTLIRAGDTLHGWRFPAEVLRRAVPRFEGSSYSRFEPHQHPAC